MAYTWPTAQSLVRGTSSDWDPLPGPFRAALCSSTSGPTIPVPSSSSALTSDSRPSQPSRPPRSSIDALNATLTKVLREILTLKVLNGQAQETLLHHCHEIMQTVSRILGVVLEGGAPSPYRDTLLTLLSSGHPLVRDVPTHDSEWTKLLTAWCRRYEDGDIGERTIYHLMAVDGFSGFTPKDLKNYFHNVLKSLSSMIQHHNRGVRAMYEYFEEDERIIALTGTDSARVVFLTLLKLYGEEEMDDQTAAKVEQNRRFIEGQVYQREAKFQDLKNLKDGTIYKTLRERYLDQWQSLDLWKVVALDILKTLAVPPSQEFKQRKMGK